MGNCQKQPFEMEEPTIDEIVQWHIEQAHCMGELGFTTNFPDAENFQHPGFDTNFNFDAVTSSLGDLERAVNGMIKDYERVKYRAAYISSNQSLLEKTKDEVHRRLLGAGKTQEDIDNYNSSGASLRDQISELERLKSGKEPAQNTTEAWVHYWADASRKERRKYLINLKINGTLHHFHIDMAGLMDSLKDCSQRLEDFYDQSRPWRYQLVFKKHSLATAALYPLNTERDYRDLIQQNKTEGVTAVLTQGDEPQDPSAVEQNLMDEDEDEDDEFGHLFEHIDWKNEVRRFRAGEKMNATQEDLEEVAGASWLLKDMSSTNRSENRDTTQGICSGQRTCGANAITPGIDTNVVSLRQKKRHKVRQDESSSVIATATLSN
ncbi:MAG: hypothetical protein LQ351_002783 [Letrouitia transgressa]|nr:MAG: hypothetical protein LQ351_002783 [Letrouitia transgressa]